MNSSKNSAEGRGVIRTKYSGDQLIFYKKDGTTEIFRINPAITGGYIVAGVVRNIRTRVAIASVNAGATILAALAGFKYRLVECTAIAIGGAAATGTTVDLLATQGAAGVKLVAYAQASLTRSTVLTSGGAGAAVLADGASYVQNDVNTAITIGKTGADFATATHIDVNLSYCIEP